MTGPSLGRHMLLTTYRKNGQPVATPVWNVPLEDGRVGMWTGAGTGKWKRIRNNPRVLVQPCSARGGVRPGAPSYSGTADIVAPGARADAIRRRIVSHHRWEIPLVKVISRLQGRLKADQVFGDTIVVITLDQAG